MTLTFFSFELETLAPIGLQKKKTRNLKVELSKSKSESAQNLHCGGHYTLQLSGVLRPLAALPDFSNFGVVSPVMPPYMCVGIYVCMCVCIYIYRCVCVYI